MPWSTSSSVPCEPSSRTVSPASSALLSSSRVSAMRCLKLSACCSSASTTCARVQRLAVVDLDQHLVFEFQCGFDLVGQHLLVEHVSDPDPDAGDLVLVARPDAAAGGADLLAAHVALGHLVDGHVIRHQQMRVGRDQQLRGVDAAVLEALQLVEQHARIDHHAVADDVGDAGRQDARRDEMEGEVLAAGQHHGVSRRCCRPGSAPPIWCGRRVGRWPCPCPRRPIGRRSGRLPAWHFSHSYLPLIVVQPVTHTISARLRVEDPLRSGRSRRNGRGGAGPMTPPTSPF